MDDRYPNSQIISVIKRYPECTLCILYGSAAAGRLTGESDIDVAVAGDRPLNKEILVNLNIELSNACKREVDILDLHTLDGIILKQIIENGKVLKKNVLLYAYFIKKVMFFDADMLGNIKYILETRAKRIAGEV